MEAFEHVAQVVVGTGKVGLERNGPPDPVHRRFSIAQLELRQPQKMQGVHMVGSLLQNTRIELDGAFDPPFLLQPQGICQRVVEGHFHGMRLLWHCWFFVHDSLLAPGFLPPQPAPRPLPDRLLCQPVLMPPA